jgi:hypothetical protein
LSRKEKESNNYEKQRKRVAKVKRRIRRNAGLPAQDYNVACQRV